MLFPDILRLHRALQCLFDGSKVHLSRPILPSIPGKEDADDHHCGWSPNRMLGPLPASYRHLRLQSSQQVLGHVSVRLLHPQLTVLVHQRCRQYCHGCDNLHLAATCFEALEPPAPAKDPAYWHLQYRLLRK